MKLSAAIDLFVADRRSLPPLRKVEFGAQKAGPRCVNTRPHGTKEHTLMQRQNTRRNARYLHPPVDDYIVAADGIGVPLLDRRGAVRAHAWIDAIDLDAIWGYRWHLNAHRGYANRSLRDGPKRHLPMHHAILPCPAGAEIDHRDGDKLNNRRGNLRVATRRQNAQNVAPRGRSRHLGVSWHSPRGKWSVQARVDGRRVFGGYYDTEDAAGEASRELRQRYGLWGGDA